MRLLVYATLAAHKLHFLDLLLEAKSVLTTPLQRKSTCCSGWGVVSTPSHLVMPFSSYGTLSLFQRFCMSYVLPHTFYHQSWPDLTSHSVTSYVSSSMSHLMMILPGYKHPCRWEVEESGFKDQYSWHHLPIWPLPLVVQS